MLPKPEALVESGRIVVRTMNAKMIDRPNSRLLESLRDKVKCKDEPNSKQRPETASSIDSKLGSQKTVSLFRFP